MDATDVVTEGSRGSEVKGGEEEQDFRCGGAARMVFHQVSPCY
jgi:hypothetical protein